ncbi:MAG: DNA internalization-related competence protein ComEC/Rec2 [Burkholderiales bacterium]|nr:DNA internalization-related competence protein ComEC/Rec2 [Burkholderiales bacterium]
MQEEQGRGGLLGMALAGAVLGTALQVQQAQLWAWWVYALILLVMPALSRPWWRTRSHGSRLKAGMTLVGVAAFTFALVGLRASYFQSNALDPALEGRDIALTGLVTAMPHRNEAGARFRLLVESAKAGGAEVVVPAHVQLGWYHGAVPGAAGVLELQRPSADLRPGERWQLTARLKAPHGHANPNGFDYELWLWEQGVQATGYVRAGPSDPVPQRIGRTWRFPVEQVRHAVRDAIYERVTDRRLAGILAALVAGDQGAIERADWDIFRATGVAHLMSISGLHVTMFAWLAAAAIGALWRRSRRLCLAWPAQHAGLVGGLLLATAYALFSGWGVPAQRTIWMLATVSLLRLSGRQWPWPWVWLLACAVVVTLDPWALLQPGFWLSFVAVGVLFATDAGRSKDGNALVRMLREQWVVTLALTPLAILLFGQVSVIGLLANLLAIPWVTLVVTPLAMSGALVAPVWDVAAWAVQALAWVLEALAKLPFATLSVAAPPLWAGAAGVLGGLLLAMRGPVGLHLLGVPLLLPVVLWQPVRPAVGEFELLAADVGQGNAVIVRTATHTLVYDTGPRYSRESDAGDRVLVPLLRQAGESVTTVVLSHRDIDHSGGAAAVLAAHPQATLQSSIAHDHDLQLLRPATRCEAGQAWRWDGVAFEVVHPVRADYATAKKPNAVSCVLKIGNGRANALLAGDIEQPQEALLLARASIAADVLLVPHHGSRTSSSDAFLAAVDPKFAMVQAGYRNRFGHPAPQVMDRYRERGIRVVASPACGAATWASAAPGEVRCERAVAPRYWRHRVD